MIRIAIVALICVAASASYAQSKRPHIVGCANVNEIVAAEAFNRGNQYKDARVFISTDALFLSRSAGHPYPGTATVIVISYVDGSIAILSYVDLPECWKMQVLERRK